MTAEKELYAAPASGTPGGEHTALCAQAWSQSSRRGNRGGKMAHGHPLCEKDLVEADAPEPVYFLRVFFLGWASRSGERQDLVLI